MKRKTQTGSKKSDMELGKENFSDPFSKTFHSIPHTARMIDTENKRNSVKTEEK